jgi:hypothetical protein
MHYRGESTGGGNFIMVTADLSTAQDWDQEQDLV